MFELSYQLYSSREFSPLSDTLKMLAEIGYTQVEGFGGVYNDLPVLAAGLKAHGLTMSTGHFGLEMLENEPDKVLEIASAVGMKAIYCPHFVYDYQGNNLVHPKQPWRIGKNWWELTNKDGNRVIKNLIEQARAGGGFHRYVWNKPSSGERVEKISYAIALDKWGWMLGTGIYIDDVVNQVEKFKVDINNRVERVFIIILAIAAVAVLAVSATGIVINIRESSMADSKLQALTQRIVDVQEEERSRVARELHDGISQILVSTKYSLEAVSMGNNGLNGQGTKALANAIVRITSAIHETRRISHDLRPGILGDLGLSTALKNLVEEFADRNGLEAEISTVAFKNTMRNDVKTGLYRVAQEALTNIERHTKATKISVRLAVEKENIVMEIKDNGSGFDPNAIRINGNQSHGIGLRNMRERILSFNGNVEIRSSNRGSSIIAKLPKSVLKPSTKSLSKVTV